LVVGWILGQKFLPFRTETFLGKGLGEFTNRPLVWSRANFDGFYYAKIARDGYQYLQQAFFPFYPKVIKFFQPFFKSFVLSGIFISNICLVCFLWLFAGLLREEGEDKKTIKQTLLFLVLFPTSFYLGCVYNESLFMLLALFSFLLAKRKKWFIAALVAGFASYTRVIGIFLLPALVYEYYESESKRTMKLRVVAAKRQIIRFNPKYLIYFFKSRAKHIKNLFFILFSGWGILRYALYLKETKGDYFYFIKVQPDFGAQRSVAKITMLYQVFWRYAKMILTVNQKDPIYFTIWLEILTAILFLALLILGWLKFKVHRPWLLFAALSFLLPTLTGTFSSLPRYVLVCFPCFLVLAKMKLPKFIYLLSGVLLLICTMMFLRGYWIS